MCVFGNGELEVCKKPTDPRLEHRRRTWIRGIFFPVFKVSKRSNKRGKVLVVYPDPPAR